MNEQNNELSGLMYRGKQITIREATIIFSEKDALIRMQREQIDELRSKHIHDNENITSSIEMLMQFSDTLCKTGCENEVVDISMGPEYKRKLISAIKQAVNIKAIADAWVVMSNDGQNVRFWSRSKEAIDGFVCNYPDARPAFPVFLTAEGKRQLKYNGL